MNSLKFPRTYSDLDAAPWCQSYEPPEHENDNFQIYINAEWLPAEMNDTITAIGPNIKGALLDLKSYYWRHIRPPA